MITDDIWVLNGSLNKKPYGVHAYDLIKTFTEFKYNSAVEGASFGDVYGQVLLAEIRFGFTLGLIHSGNTPTIIPPQSARKRAFGTATIRGRDLFPLINKNGADAIGIALAKGA